MGNYLRRLVGKLAVGARTPSTDSSGDSAAVSPATSQVDFTGSEREELQRGTASAEVQRKALMMLDEAEAEIRRLQRLRDEEYRRMISLRQIAVAWQGGYFALLDPNSDWSKIVARERAKDAVKTTDAPPLP